MLSRLSVSSGPGRRLRRWCSSGSLRISPLHPEFHATLPNSSHPVFIDLSRFSLGAFTTNLDNRLHALYAQ